MSDRREFPDRLKLQILKRAMDDGGRVRCEGCGGVLKLKQWEVDHVIAEGLVADKTKALTAEDGQLLGYCCHRGEDGKTNADVARIAKSKRQEKSHLLPKSRSSFRKPPAGSRWDWKLGRRIFDAKGAGND